MAAEVFVQKTPDGLLRPISESDVEALKAVPVGKPVRATVTQPRNVKFHKKCFALLKLSFDLWAERMPMREYKGTPVRADFERFRKDLVILAGFYRPVFNARGEVRVEPESLNFASMSEERFAEVYSALIDTILSKILVGITSRKDLEDAVERVLRFA